MNDDAKYHVVPALLLLFGLAKAYDVASQFVAFQFGYVDGVFTPPSRHVLPEWLSPDVLVWVLAFAPFVLSVVLIWGVWTRYSTGGGLTDWWLAARWALIPAGLAFGLLWYYSWEVHNPFARHTAWSPGAHPGVAVVGSRAAARTADWRSGARARELPVLAG